MEIFDIFIAYVAWEGSGKLRPVLVIERQDTVLSVFNITTRYDEKSEVIRSKYFKINDWQQAGLDKPSYIDTATIRNLPKVAWDGKTPIGKLTEADKLRFLDFLPY
ncbi:MAG: hypothetical protein FWB96_09755 [Defluviitaleaceae bacterium]|nr:hypothetical protein [Defluviitaleaceae bacterium]MCL2263101.1 hypothetical protein [Defluviitaleaceae bacterium]